MIDDDVNEEVTDPKGTAQRQLRALLNGGYLVETGRDAQGVYYQAPPESNVQRYNDRTGEWEPAEPLPFYRWVGPNPFAWLRRKMGR